MLCRPRTLTPAALAARPPSAPCSTRKKSIAGSDGAKPQSTELRVKITRQIMKKRLRPRMFANQALVGSTMAFDTRYEVRIQVLSVVVAAKVPAMYGSATLAMVMSRISMKAAIATTTAMSHGLKLGVQSASLCPTRTPRLGEPGKGIALSALMPVGASLAAAGRTWR